MSSKTRKSLNFILPLFLVVTIFLSNVSLNKDDLKIEDEDITENENKVFSEEDNLIDYTKFEVLSPIQGLNEFDEFKSAIDQKAKYTNFHGSLLVAYKDQIIFQEEYGFMDPINKLRLQPHTSFELASVSKQFTAAAILMLAEENCIDINQSVKQYIPEFKFEEVSIRHLLKHSSGLWDYMYLTEAFWKNTTAPINEDVVQLISKYQNSLNFRPGTRFNYNNSNYVVLAALIEKVSGISYENFIEERIFDQLCLNDSYVGIANRKHTYVADAFMGYGRGYVSLPASFHNQALGDKGIYASSTDLFRWFTALKNGDLLTKENVDLMFNQDEFDDFKYGMGFRTKYSESQEQIIYHNGIWDGYRNGLTYLPKDDLVIILLSNTQNRNKKYLQKYLIHKTKDFIQSPRLQQEFSQLEDIINLEQNLIL